MLVDGWVGGQFVVNPPCTMKIVSIRHGIALYVTPIVQLIGRK